MNDIKILTKAEVLEKEFTLYGTIEEPLFLAKDVAEWIGLSNVSDMISRIDESEVTKLNLGGLQGECNFLTEDGLYEVLMQSRKPIAKLFKKEVKNILKSIRINGIYATDNVIEQILNNPDWGIELLTKLKEERAARVEAEKTVAILTHTNKTYTVTEVAKEIGMKSANELNQKLHDMGIQYKVNETWVPYTDYAELAWFDIKQETLDNGKIIYHRRITGIGRKAIVALFQGKDKENGN